MRVLSLASVCFASALAAQSVSPVHFTAAEGLSNNVFPFSTTTPFRYAQVHDDVPAMTIVGMGFRHNAATVIYAAHTVTIDAWMSTAVTTAATMSTTFDNNHGLDKIQVITNRTYSHPASNPFDLPGLFVLDYAFDVPFVYGGAGPLCWEVHVTARTGSATHDAIGTSANPALAINRAGAGCLSTGRTTAMALTPTSTMAWTTPTGTLTLNASNMLASGPGFVTHGFSKTIWNNIPLPAPIPTSTGAPSGTCTAYADVVTAALVTATTTGSATYAFGFVPTPSLHGLTLLSQLWGLDLAANPFGITTSNLALHQVVAPVTTMPVTRVFLSGSLGPTGSLGLNSGLVTRFR